MLPLFLNPVSLVFLSRRCSQYSSGYPFSHFPFRFYHFGPCKNCCVQTIFISPSFPYSNFSFLPFVSVFPFRAALFSLVAVLFSVESDKSNYTFKLRYAVLSPFFRRLFYTLPATVSASFSFPFSPFYRSSRILPSSLLFRLLHLPHFAPHFFTVLLVLGFLSSVVK